MKIPFVEKTQFPFPCTVSYKAPIVTVLQRQATTSRHLSAAAASQSREHEAGQTNPAYDDQIDFATR